MSTIAVIGTGNVGSALGSALGAAGHEIVYGSRSPDSDSARSALERTPGARADSPAQAAAAAAVVILAVPWPSVQETIEELGDLDGRILVDAVNPLKPDLSGLAVAGEDSAGERLAALVPGAHVVKAFNTTGSDNLHDPRYADGALAMLICGEDAAAKETVAGLARDIGFDVVDAGGIEASRRLEALALLWIGLAYGQGQGPTFGFRVIHR